MHDRILIISAVVMGCIVGFLPLLVGMPLCGI